MSLISRCSVSSSANIDQMKTLIAVILALAACASTEPTRGKRDTGISSGYGGAYGYGLSIVSGNEHLKSGFDTIRNSGDAKDYASTPRAIGVNTHVPLGLAISSGYGGAYGYTPSSNVNNKSSHSSSGIATSNGSEQANDYASTPKADNNKYLLDMATSNGHHGDFVTPIAFDVAKNSRSGLAVSSGYGRAYGYALSSKGINANNINLPPGLASVSAYDMVYGNASPPKLLNVNEDLSSGVGISSGYGGAYSYTPIPRVININNELPSAIAVKKTYGRLYGYSRSPTPTPNDDLKGQRAEQIPQVINASKTVLASKPMLNIFPGYSGYGNGIGSQSGYSLKPNLSNYVFAYANGWL